VAPLMGHCKLRPDMEIETAMRLRLNLVVLVLQDNAYGMIR
jgi:thiamine pyrophosphate-dependent acetolactate synthase large subunit-like protein